MTSTQIATVRVTLNGADIAIPLGSSLGAFLDARGINRRMVAIEYNGEILPRHAWDATLLRDGDVLEAVQMVGGG